ncbi:MAG: DnaD domain protein [Clostridiales Family XIII bacterium]|jgi:hypothetical protein|nr:DnaD domain protein [Clostridiales Family XIII bacterium]
MTYSIERPRNSNLGDTAISNLFITEYMPDVPDGEFVKVYIYAYMCCRQGVALTHSELAVRLGLPVEKILAAWRYFSDRRIVRKIPAAPDGETHFDVEFIDIKGRVFCAEESPSKGAEERARTALEDRDRKALFEKIAAICGAPSMGSDDARKIMRWLDEWEATPAIVECAYIYCRDTAKNTRTDYVGRVVRKWAEQGLRTGEDASEYLAAVDARFGLYKQLMEALGMQYSRITEAEKQIFDQWLDEYGYTPQRLLELSAKTAGASNKLTYMGGIIRKDREGSGGSGGVGGSGGISGRSGYYHNVRVKNEEGAKARREEVYSAAPMIRRAEEEIEYLSIELTKLLISDMSDKKSAVDRISADIRTKTAERDRLMEKAGFEPGYMDIKYDCVRCKDTGMLENGTSCDCLPA